MPAWLVLCLVYVSWNIAGYLEKSIFPDSFIADCSYWLHERIFVVVCFYNLVLFLRRSLYKRYVWLAKTLMWIAAAKLIYVILVLTGALRLNEGWILTGFFFIIGMGYIIVKWEKQQRPY